MKKLFLLSLIAMLTSTSCVNEIDRLRDAQIKYPKCVVQPTTSLMSDRGYTVMVEDTLQRQIYVLRYYPFSTSRVLDIRNIK